jgi:hypothetical protein
MEILVVLVVGYLIFQFLKGTRNARKSDIAISSYLVIEYGYTREEANKLWFKYNNNVIRWEIEGLSPKEIAMKIVNIEKG